MSELKCDGCRAKLSPVDESIKFITCEWCRETNKNPNYNENPSPKAIKGVPILPKNPTINHPNRETITQKVAPTHGHHDTGRPINKWVSFILCFFLGYFGAHKFYEGKTATGFIYFFTLGLLGVGWLLDLIIILCKSNPYYVNK